MAHDVVAVEAFAGPEVIDTEGAVWSTVNVTAKAGMNRVQWAMTSAAGAGGGGRGGAGGAEDGDAHRIQAVDKGRHVGDLDRFAMTVAAMRGDLHDATRDFDVKPCHGLLHRYATGFKQHGRDSHEVGAGARHVFGRFHDDRGDRTIRRHRGDQEIRVTRHAAARLRIPVLDRIFRQLFAHLDDGEHAAHLDGAVRAGAHHHR